MESDRASWRRALAQSDTLAKQIRELARAHSAIDQFSNAMRSLQSPALKLAQQYQDLLSANSSAMRSLTAWQEAQSALGENIRRVLDPLDGIRKSLLLDQTAQKLANELAAADSIQEHVRRLVDKTEGFGSVARLLAQQTDESRERNKRLLDRVTGGNSIQNYLKEFEAINKRWRVPNEVLGIVGSFREIEEQLGRVTLPTIDWGSAGALAKVLGSKGLEEQLMLLGIGADGSMHQPSEESERGILSRRQSDAVTLLSLLLSLLFFIYQEMSSQKDKATAEAIQTQTTATLHAQAQQIQNLTVLIGQALARAAEEPEERFVVRERMVTVRSKPEHGASIEGKLLPNEVVRAIDRKGRWVEVEYYHWLHAEYRTGWVLKHYLERVPPNYSKRDNAASAASAASADHPSSLPDR